jgi:hypothetical protein
MTLVIPSPAASLISMSLVGRKILMEAAAITYP